MTKFCPNAGRKFRSLATAVLLLLLLLLMAATLSSADQEGGLDDETAYLKLIMAENRSLALPGNYIVVFNASLVEDLQEALDELRGQADDQNDTSGLNISIAVEREFPRLKMAKISVGVMEDDLSDADDETLMESRRIKLLSWLRSVLVDTIEEVRTSYIAYEHTTTYSYTLFRVLSSVLPVDVIEIGRLGSVGPFLCACSGTAPVDGMEWRAFCACICYLLHVVVTSLADHF
jgi:hypothetical protein